MRFAFHRDLALGRYAPLDTPLHRLDPRTKLVAFAGIVVALLRAGPLSAAALTAGLGLVAAGSGLPPARLLGSLRAIAWILAVTLGVHALWLGPRVYGGVVPGFVEGVAAAVRVVGLLVVAALLTHATEPIRLADGLARLFGFLERMRVPVRDLVLVLTLSLRFLPTVLEEAQRIVLAQRARGARFEGGPLERGRRLLPLAVPLFASCLHRADRLALAMEARGLRPGGARTQLEPLSFRAVDAWTLVGTGLILAAILWLGR